MVTHREILTGGGGTKFPKLTIQSSDVVFSSAGTCITLHICTQYNHTSYSVLMITKVIGVSIEVEVSR